MHIYLFIPFNVFLLYFVVKYGLILSSGLFLRPREGQKFGSSRVPKTALMSARDILVSPLTSYIYISCELQYICTYFLLFLLKGWVHMYVYITETFVVSHLSFNNTFYPILVLQTPESFFNIHAALAEFQDFVY